MGFWRILLRLRWGVQQGVFAYFTVLNTGLG